MKRILIPTLLAVTVSFFTGCGNSQPTLTSKPTKNINMNQCMMDNVNAPAWVCDGGANMSGGLYAMGSAETNPIGYSFQLTEATAAARDALARQISVKVNNMFKQFEATTGIGKNQTADKATQNVSKQVTSQLLKGSKVVKTWKSPSGTLFVLVGMQNTKQLKQNVIMATKSSFKKDNALWQKFLAQKADKELDQAVAKEFGNKN